MSISKKLIVPVGGQWTKQVEVWILRECKAMLRRDVPTALGKLLMILRIPVSEEYEES
jgi:hypothetical protein